MQLCFLPAGAGGCSCGGQRWVEVVLVSLCWERQTALCTWWCRAGEPSLLMVLLICYCFPPVRLKVMNILLLHRHLVAPPFFSYLCICCACVGLCVGFFCLKLLLDCAYVFLECITLSVFNVSQRSISLVHASVAINPAWILSTNS